MNYPWWPKYNIFDNVYSSLFFYCFLIVTQVSSYCETTCINYDFIKSCILMIISTCLMQFFEKNQPCIYIKFRGLFHPKLRSIAFNLNSHKKKYILTYRRDQKMAYTNNISTTNWFVEWEIRQWLMIS